MKAVLTTKKPLSLIEVWRAALKFYGPAFSQLWPMILIYQIIIVGFDWLLILAKNKPGFIFYATPIFIITVIIHIFVAAVALHKIKTINDGKNKTIGFSLNAVKSKFWILLASQLLASLFFLLGFAAIIVPGIYLAVTLFFIQPIVLFENKHIWESIKGSFELVRHNWWRNFVFILSIPIAFAIPIIFINLIGPFLAGVDYGTFAKLEQNTIWYHLSIQFFYGLLILPISYGLVLAQYYNLLARKKLK